LRRERRSRSSGSSASHSRCSWRSTGRSGTTTAVFTVTFDGGVLAGADQPEMTAVASGGSTAAVATTTNGFGGTVVSTGAQMQIQGSLTVAGEIWEGRDELLRLISDLGLAERVTFTEGYVPTDEVPRLFAAADALVLPYRSATASQNALIAFEFGIPVIATRAGALADAVTDGVNGLLCEPGDVSGLGEAIRRLYQPGELELLRGGVTFPDPGPAWDDYVAAVEKAALRSS